MNLRFPDNSSINSDSFLLDKNRNSRDISSGNFLAKLCINGCPRLGLIRNKSGILMTSQSSRF